MGRKKYSSKRSANLKVQPAAQNPKFNMYRQLAKKGVTSGLNKKTLTLTEDNLKVLSSINQPTTSFELPKKDECQSMFSSEEEFTDEKMKSLKGYKDEVISEAATFATNFTNCTNASFNTFMDKFDPNSGVQKEMLTMLAASTELINASGKEGSEEDYFEVLLQTIFTCENVISLTANVILLYYVIRRLPANKLREKHSQFQSITCELLKKYLHESNATFVRFLLKSYTTVMKSLEITDWELLDTQNGYSDILLQLITSSKSRIRKVVHTSILSLVSNVQVTVKANNIINPNAKQVHPISAITADFCIRRIKDTSGDDVTSALYILNLFKEVLPFLNTDDLKKCVETVLSLLLLGNVLIFTNCMQVLENVFVSRTTHLTPDMNGKLLTALYEYAPEMSDEQPFLAWCSVMKHGALCALQKDIQVFSDHFLKLFGYLTNCFQSTSIVLRGYCTQCMNELLYDSIKTVDSFKPSVFIAIGESLHTFLCYKYTDSFKYIFRLFCTFFLLKEEPFTGIVTKIFSKLVEMKESFGSELERVNFEKPATILLKHRGVSFVLNLAPLKVIEDRKVLQNLWIISAIKQLHNRPLHIESFITHIVPIIEKISENANNFVDEKMRTKDTNGWLLVHSELWSLLPTFTAAPLDVVTHFKSIAKLLGVSLSSQPHTRPFIQRALRQLINNCKDDDLVEITKYSKNYVPILLNLYFSSNVNKAEKLGLFETLNHFFTISDASLIESYYDKATVSFATENDLEKKALFWDVLRIMTCHLKNEQKVIAAFESALVTAANNVKVKEQKKSLRLVEELFKSPNFKMLEKHYEEKGESLYKNMINYFAEKYSSITILAAQAAFVRLIEFIIRSKYTEEKMPLDEMNGLLNILVKIFHAKKSAKLTQSTFSVLDTLVECSDVGVASCVQFLAKKQEEGSGEEERATILFILHHTMIKYNDQMDIETKTYVIKTLIANLDSESRKLVQTVLMFIKDWFRISSKEEVLPFINHFTGYLNKISNPLEPRYRYKIKAIMEKLLKKYGHELVIKLIDRKYHALIKSLERKLEITKDGEKESRKRHDFYDSEDEEEESDGDENENEPKARRSSKRWRFDEDEEFDGLQLFDQEDMPMEDQATVQPKKTERKVQFNMNETIRIDLEGNIVERNLEEEEEKESSKPPVKYMDEKMPMLGRKKIEEEDDSDESDEDDGAVKKRKKGGKPIADRIMDKYRRKRGIHRDTTITGDQYRSNKAKGDMKKPGIPDPYAYLPLNRSTLNKRKASKNSKQFKNLVNAAVKGAKGARRMRR